MIRSPRPSDQAYVASTWHKSILRGTYPHERHKTARSGSQLTALIDAVLDRKDTRVLVRVRAHDRDSIMGWVMFVDGVGVPVVHYVYSRADDRESGIATALLFQAGVRKDQPVVCTSDGPNSALLRARYPLATYMPLAEFLRPVKVS